jgi:hypothetical protein
MRAVVGDIRRNTDPGTKRLDVESRRLLEFAAVWAPYGGASEEDILVNFGLTPDRFVERLWKIIPEIKARNDVIGLIARAYPNRRHTDNSVSHR